MFSRRYLERLSGETGFQIGSLEKQMHLLHILREIRRHPFLKEKFTLKGGTAINVFVHDLPRLSVDIDLNYIGAIKLKEMKVERPKIEETLQKLLTAEGFEVKRLPGEHAGGKWRLNTNSALGGTFTLELDVNYLFRVPLGEIQQLVPYNLDEEYREPFPVVSMEELYAGKILALLFRGAARDLYDVYTAVSDHRLQSTPSLKQTTLLLGISNREDWREINIGRVYDITQAQIKSELIPMLMQEEEFDLERAKEQIEPLLKDLLDYSEGEKAFIEKFLSHGEFEPELIIDDLQKARRIKRHPALLWKLQNVRQHLGKDK